MNSARRPALEGKSVLVTRGEMNSNQENKLTSLLKELGAEVIEKPVLFLSEPESFADLDCALNSLESFDWIVFASRTAAQSVISRLETLNRDFSILKKLKIAAVGKSTAAYLEENKLQTAFIPSKFNAMGLVEEFPDKDKLSGTRIFWPRTLAGKTTISDGLTAYGAKVVSAEAYTSGMPEESAVLSKELEELMVNKIDIVTFTSSQTVRNFAALLSSKTGDKKLSDCYPRIIVAAIGPETAGVAADVYGRIDVVAREYTIEGLVSELAHYFDLS